MKKWFHISPPQDPSSFSKRLYESSFLRSLPFYLTMPAIGLLAADNQVATLAYMAIKMASVDYLRGQQRVLRNSFNRFADESLSSREKADIEPLLRTLNKRSDKDLSFSINDLNHLKQPLAVSFGIAAGAYTQNPVIGVAVAAETLAIQEMLHLGKIKIQSLFEYSKTSFYL